MSQAAQSFGANHVPTHADQWSKISVTGHSCRIFEPTNPSPHGYTILYLHGSHVENLADYPRITQQFEQHGLRVIAPITGVTWWSDRIAEEFDTKITVEKYVLQHVLPFIAERWQCTPPRIALLGLSMGGQGALRLSYKYPNIFPTVAAVFPAIDFQKRIDEGDPTLSRMYRDAEDGRQDTATLHIHPLNWPRNQWFCCDPDDVRWWDSADRLRMKLFSLGVPFECDLETRAGGHTWKYFSRMAEPAFAFLMDRLERERLRVT